VDKGNLPFVAGGTGLYIKALTEGIFDAPGADKEIREKLRKEAEEAGLTSLYNKLRDVDPEAAGKIGPANTHRIIRALEIYYMTGHPISQHHKEHAFREAYYALKIGLYAERETYKNIDYRVDSMIRAGSSMRLSASLKWDTGRI
jgi:tRNA dimethylallyltransferase